MLHAEGSDCCLGNASRCCPDAPTGPGPRGLLWSVGTADSGEDRSDKYARNKAPFVSMDMQGYSFSCRRSLARIAAVLGEHDTAARWAAAAVELAAATKAGLWRDELHAMFDIDDAGDWVTTLMCVSFDLAARLVIHCHPLPQNDAVPSSS